MDIESALDLATAKLHREIDENIDDVSQPPDKELQAIQLHHDDDMLSNEELEKIALECGEGFWGTLNAAIAHPN